MKKILLVTDAWAPQVNGVVRVQDAHIRALMARGYEVVVIEPSQFYTIPLPRYPDIRLALFPRRRIGRVIEEHKPDAIHLMTEGPFGVGGAVCVLQKGDTLYDLVPYASPALRRYTSTWAPAPYPVPSLAFPLCSDPHNGLNQ